MEWRINSTKNTSELQKRYWYPIQWVWTDGKPRMLSSENVGNIHFTKIDGEQVATKNLNPKKSKKVMGVWKYPLEYITKQIKDLINKIQEWKSF